MYNHRKIEKLPIRHDFHGSKLKLTPAVVKKTHNNAVDLRAPAKSKTVTQSLNRITDYEKNQPSTSATLDGLSPERPKTAVLERGTIVNGPIDNNQSQDDVHQDYDDDFESYASDFEEYKSSISEVSCSDAADTSLEKSEKEYNKDEEGKLDSGNYELPESKPVQVLSEIVETAENSDRALDEGFEDANASLHFINFGRAQEKLQKQMLFQKRLQRGMQLLSMIHLDNVIFTILDLEPIPYENFIMYYGQQGCVQARCQTGDDFYNESTQTDGIFCENKWTQYPPNIPAPETFIETICHNYVLGVGGDIITKHTLVFNEHHLSAFIQRTSDLLINIILDDRATQCNSGPQVIPSFARGTLKLQAGNSIRSLPVNLSNSHFFTTVHNDCIKLWRYGYFDTPEIVLKGVNQITCAAFDSIESNILYGGLASGSIVAWNTDAKEQCTPFYASPASINHSFSIQCIHAFSQNSNTSNLDINHLFRELITLQENGNINIWSVILSKTSYLKYIRLIKRKTIIIGHAFDKFAIKTNCLVFSAISHSKLFISNSLDGTIWKRNILETDKPVRIHHATNRENSAITCLESCPFSDDYFMAGYETGVIKLYSRYCSRELMKIETTSGRNRTSVINMHWSHNRPFILYALLRPSLICIWDIGYSDHEPKISFSLDEDILHMQGLYSNSICESCLAVISLSGGVQIFILNEEYGKQEKDKLAYDKQQLIDYLNKIF